LSDAHSNRSVNTSLPPLRNCPDPLALLPGCLCSLVWMETLCPASSHTAQAPPVGDFDPTAGKISAKWPVEYHVKVLNERLSPAKRTSAEEVEEAESGSLWRQERQKRTMLYVLSEPFTFKYGTLCGVVIMVLLPYLFRPCRQFSRCA